MRNTRILLAIALSLGFVAESAASPRCTASMADWQPRQALEAKLKAEGWTIRRIKTDDGCYKVHGTRADGRRVKATFSPDTLVLIREKLRDDD